MAVVKVSDVLQNWKTTFEIKGMFKWFCNTEEAVKTRREESTEQSREKINEIKER